MRAKRVYFVYAVKANQFLSWKTRGPAKPGIPDSVEQHGSTLYITLRTQHINNFKKGS